MIERVFGAWARKDKFAHVGHVKKGTGVAGVKVFCDDAARVLDGHLPAAEIHHGRARGEVDVIQLGTFELAHIANPPEKRVGSTSPLFRWEQNVCASVTIPERFPAHFSLARVAPSVCGIGSRTLRSVVPVRSFCLRVFSPSAPRVCPRHLPDRSSEPVCCCRVHFMNFNILPC